MKLFVPKIALLLVAAAPSTTVVTGQFTCTLGASDEDGCLSSKDDDGQYCVWCSLSSFGFCLNEAAAEAAEQTLPGVSCDRHSGSDDDATPSTDDDSTPKPPTPTTDDDNITPNDDGLPPDYWTCLKKKDSKSCDATEDCVWCTSKLGWGVCMSGPSAESAKDSHFFTCDDKDTPTPSPTPVPSAESAEEGEHNAGLFGVDWEHIMDPYDTSCIQASISDPTQEGCVSTLDADGNACKWCSLAGITNLCLNEEQASMGSQLGVTCDDEQQDEEVDNEDEDTLPIEEEDETETKVNDPLDPSCVMEFLQDQTEDACVSTMDQDGNPCKWCSLQGMNMCLTSEQADMGQQIGITCDSSSNDSVTAVKYMRG